MEESTYTVWKERGETMGELLDRFKVEHPELSDVPITYAGRLDPMAEGIVILLVGSAVHQKDEFLHLDKEYEFEVLWGFETDTLDLLGLVVRHTPIPLPPSRREGEMHMLTQDFIGKQIQKYPAYSSRKVGGKPLFQWARENRLQEITIPEHEVEIYSIEVCSQRTLSGAELLKTIEENISTVKGNFRQGEIIKLWRETLEPLKNTEFCISTMKAKVSSGTYIRSLVEEMGNRLEWGALAYSIVRKSIGNISIDCLH